MTPTQIGLAVIAALTLALGVVARDDYNLRVEHAAYVKTQEAIVAAQKSEAERKEAEIRAKDQEIENANAEAAARRSRYDASIASLRDDLARAKRVPQAHTTARVCDDSAADRRLSDATDRFREAVGQYEQAVTQLRGGVRELLRDAEQQTATLMSCQAALKVRTQ
jgi:hypothetical protein